MEALLPKKILIISSKGDETEAAAINLCKELSSDPVFVKLGIKPQVVRYENRTPKQILEEYLRNETSARFIFLHDRNTTLSSFPLVVENSPGLIVKTKTVEMQQIKSALIGMYT